MNGYMTAEEVAEFVHLSLQTIRRYTMQKKIPFHKIDRAVRFKKSEIEEWVEKRQSENALLSVSSSADDNELFTCSNGGNE